MLYVQESNLRVDMIRRVGLVIRHFFVTSQIVVFERENVWVTD